VTCSHLQGYVPEWILLEKQIRQAVERARLQLKRTLKTIHVEHLPTDTSDRTYLNEDCRWTRATNAFRVDIAAINSDINKLNLVVPMLWRQQVTDVVHR
jgi:hypothetical protein